MAQTLTQELSRELGRVVIDKTGIAGRYDVTLKWTPDTGSGSINSGTESTAPPPDSGPSIFTAFQEHLGLKLEFTVRPSCAHYFQLILCLSGMAGMRRCFWDIPTSERLNIVTSALALAQ
jgi:hypothetical protein